MTNTPQTIQASSAPVNTSERLIVALDYDNIDQAKQLVKTLGDSVNFYKVGLELFMSGKYYDLIDWLTAQNKKIFADLKFFDVPQTVGKAVKQLQNRGITFATVHGNDEIMKYAAQNKGDVKILAVTALTSLDQGDLNDLGFDCDPQTLVLSRAKRAIQSGCDGVVSSGLEAQSLKQAYNDKLLIITPGIRPVINQDDQKRTVTVPQAFELGADYIVVGRPITQATDPKAQAVEIQKQIATTINAKFLQ